MRGTRLILVAGLLLLPSSPLRAQTPVDPYFEFMIGRRLESAGDAKGAQAALERAQAAAPKSGELRAEIASFFLRQNRTQEAERAAREALALDDNAIEAHRVLGLLTSSNNATAEESIAHLERVLATPSGATDVAVRFNLGRMYFLNDANAKAIEVLQPLVDDQPYLVQARLLLVQALSDTNQVDSAIDVLAPGVEDDPRLNSTLAGLYERAGRTREAADAYGKAAAFNPTSRDLQIRYASALLAVQNRESAQQALDVLMRLTARNARDTGALYLQSQAYRRLGNLFGAERAARDILAVDANNVSGAYALAQVYGQTHRYKEVVAQLEPVVNAALARGENVQTIMAYLATAYQGLGQHDRAINVLKQAKAANPDGSSMDFYLVQAYLSAKRYTDAAAAAQQAQSEHPTEIRFTNLYARSLFLSGDAPRAFEILEGVIKAHPTEIDPYLTLADLYGNGGRVDDGLRLLDRAATQFPDDIDVSFRRAAILAEAKRPGDAEQAFRRVLEREPDNADALNYLGYMLADSGQRLDEAIALITKALDLEADNPSYLDSLGWAYFKKGDLAQAEQHLSRAAAVLPLNSVVQDHFGDLLARAGRFREAVTAWTRALEGDGQDISRTVIEGKIRDARAKAR